jgi:sulfatase modifying factor 1
MKRAYLVAALFAVFTLNFNLQAALITIDWVTVGDPGNAADTTTYGAVADSFRIMKFEFQNSQYAAFLNAVDPNGTNPNSVYSANMGGNARGGISFTSDNASGSKYAIRPNMGDKPVNYVSWWDAARVANWLQNGQGSGDTETGAYTLNNATSGTAPAVNSGATFYIPTEDQWYKAAFYKGGSTNAGYWDYATQSDSAPTAVTADATTGIGSAGNTGNFANFNRTADWGSPSQNGNVTTVGSNGGASAYGAFDMSGNVQEWTDLTGAADSSRMLRGGDWATDGQGAFLLSSSNRSSFGASSSSDRIGFRLASPVATPIPEPGTWAAMAIFAGGAAYAGWRRRKSAKVA